MSLAPLGFDMQSLAKSAAAAARGSAARPAYIHHHRSDAVRRYLNFGQSINEDATPHLDANMLRRVAEKNAILAAVVKTRVNQIAEHFRRPQSERGIGARVVQRDRRKPLTQGAAKRIEEIEGILFRGGMVTEHPVTGQPGVWDGHYEVQADDLNTAIRKLCHDTLVLDRVFIEVEGSVKIRGRARNPVMFWRPADAGLIRTVDTPRYDPQIRRDLVHIHDDGRQEGMVAYVMLDPQSYQSGVIREYAWDEGAIGFRNPRTEIGTFGYGKSEIEECVDAIVGILYGMQANKEYFTSNHVPLGFLNLIGNYGPEALAEIRQHFKQTVGNPNHYYEFPVFSSLPGQGANAQWVPLMDRTKQDVIFKVYMELCTAIVCAVFQIQPEEIGFASFGGATSTLNSGDPESTFQQGQSKGLLPKVLWFCDFLSRNVVQRVDEDFELVIQGLESRYSPEALLQEQLNSAMMANGLSLNDVRALQDLPPKYDPLNPKLWREVEHRIGERWFESPTARVNAIRDEYERQGGQLGSYPDAPFNAAGAMPVWMQEHGITEQQQTGEDMRGAANAEMDGARSEEQAESQGARDQLAQFQQGQDERDAEQSQQEAEDARSGALQVPQVEDARARFAGKPGGGKPGGGGGFAGSRLGKSYAERRQHLNRIVHIGPRDE